MQAAVYRVLGVRVELVVVLLDQDGYFKGMTRLSFFPSSVFLSLGSSTAGALEMATKRSLSISETRDRAAAVRLEYRNGTMLKNMEPTWGRVIATSARSGGRALKQERVPRLGSTV